MGRALIDSTVAKPYRVRVEIPSKVSVFNTTLEIKGKHGVLIAIDETGFYQVNLEVNGRIHTVLFPIPSTVLIFNDPLPASSPDFEIER